MAASEFSAPVLTANPTVGAVELLWGAVAGALRYELSSWTSAGGWQPIGGDDLTGTTFNHPGPAVGTTYYYWVRAVSASGDTTAWSERVSATVPSTLSPTATSTPTATPTTTPTTTLSTAPTATLTATPTSTASLFSAPVLTAVATEGAVDLSWGAVAGAARYHLWTWTNAAGWQQIGGDNLTGTTYNHAELTVGTSYYYLMRAVSGSSDTSPWSEQVSATVTSAQALTPTLTPTPTPTLTPTPTPTVGSQLSSPPQSLNVNSYYRKYLDVRGVAVMSSHDVSDEELYQVRDTILAMLSDRPDILNTAAEIGYRVTIYPDRFEQGGLVTDLPEFRDSGLLENVQGAAGRTPYGWVAAAPETARHCNHVLIHEVAHLVEDALRLQPGSEEFLTRLESAYRSAILRGRWQERYASTDLLEYWAEAVRAWFTPSEFAGWLGPGYQKLADYDPIAAALVEDVFGNAPPISFCEIQRFELRGTLIGPDSQPPQADTYVLHLSMRSPAGAKKLYGSSTAVRGSDSTFVFERIPIEKVFLSAAAEAPHIVIGLYRNDSAANVECPAAGFLGHDGSIVRSVNPANWMRLEVTGTPISGITLSIPAQYDWTPIHTCI